jgi:shikimate 5-dehydrogenase
MMTYTPALKETFYFIGVTTTQSSIMKVFPAWAEYLGLGDVVIKGIDFEPHSDPAAYREAVSFIKNDPLSRGALVTTHKLDLYDASKDLFEVIDPHATAMAETSCISKRGDKLICHAKDPISSGLTIDGFLENNHFENTSGDLFCMGAGGSTIAMTWHLQQKYRGKNRPERIVVSDISQERLNHIRDFHETLKTDINIEYVLVRTPEDNDIILHGLPEGSMIVNATGLGKDAPGSPLTNDAQFPQNAVVWELNYRGDLIFLYQAKSQKQNRSLQIEDGWNYFIYGWTQVIAEVFDIDIPTSGPEFDAISDIARNIK